MIRILLGHPSRLMCDSLRTAVDDEQDVHVVGCATTAEEFHFLLPHANLVLLCTELKDATAFELLDDMRMTHPSIKALILGITEQPETILRYIEAGAAGYILQNESVEDMVEKLEAAYEEKAIISPVMAAAMMDRLSQLANLEIPGVFTDPRRAQVEELTPREEEVLELIGEGYTNQEIANALFIECGTVKNHVHNILKKLEVSNRHEASALYQLQGQPAMAA